MAGQAIEPLFNQMYDETSQKVLIYITSNAETLLIFRISFRKPTQSFFHSEKRRRICPKLGGLCHANCKTKGLPALYPAAKKLKNGLPIERENREGEPFEAALQTQEPSIDDRLVTDALLAEIRLHLRGKPAVTQKIFYLFYNMEQTIPQIAAELQMTESNVKNRLYRTLSELRAKYQP